MSAGSTGRMPQDFAGTVETDRSFGYVPSTAWAEVPGFSSRMVVTVSASSTGRSARRITGSCCRKDLCPGGPLSLETEPACQRVLGNENLQAGLGVIVTAEVPDSSLVRRSK